MTSTLILIVFYHIITATVFIGLQLMDVASIVFDFTYLYLVMKEAR